MHAIRDEAIGIKSFELVSADGRNLPAFTAGAHIDLRIDENTVRSYSLCNDPIERGHYVIAVKCSAESRGGSAAMHERVKVGDELTIEGLRNHFPLQRNAKHHVLVAAGVGITPLLSMAQQLQRESNSFELLYFTRSAAHAAFWELLLPPRFAGKVQLHHGIGAQRITDLMRCMLATRADGHHLYVCGPRGFMDSVRGAASASWPPEAVHVEHFGADAQALAGERHPFELQLGRSGRTLQVPQDRSIADVLNGNGVPVVTSCREGVCGSCVTGVLEGRCDHRDVFLSDKERARGDRIMVCVSRASGPRLVLDL